MFLLAYFICVAPLLSVFYFAALAVCWVEFDCIRTVWVGMFRVACACSGLKDGTFGRERVLAGIRDVRAGIRDVHAGVRDVQEKVDHGL